MERQQIRTRRTALEWTQEQLGIKAGIEPAGARQQINRIEGGYAASEERLKAISEALKKGEADRRAVAAFLAGRASNN